MRHNRFQWYNQFRLLLTLLRTIPKRPPLIIHIPYPFERQLQLKSSKLVRKYKHYLQKQIIRQNWGKVINDTIYSNSSTSNIETNEYSKYGDISYQLSTSDGNNSSSLEKYNTNRGNYINQTNHIQPNFTKHKRKNIIPP